MCSQGDFPPYDAPPDDRIAVLVDAAPMPPGFSLFVTPQRTYKYRNLWSIVVMRDGERVHGRAYYNVAAGIVAAQRWAWATAEVPA